MGDWTVELRAVAPVRMRLLVKDAASADAAKRQAESFAKRDAAWRGATHDGVGAVQLVQVIDARPASKADSARGRRDGDG